jgi:DNA-binding response OmpR family regulator
MPQPPVITPAEKSSMCQRILIVDDDGQIRASLAKALRAEDYAVVLAADGQEGIERLCANNIDLLLLDLSLPVTSAWDLFGRLTLMKPLLPVIIITGCRSYYESARLAGIGALFEKPLDLPLLLQTIKELLVEPREKQLQRLVGLHHYLRHARQLHCCAK